jgi:hypothetical protein
MVQMETFLGDWLGNETDVPRETCEEILSHPLGGVEGAYRLSSSTANKRAALELWARRRTGSPPPCFNAFVSASRRVARSVDYWA